MRILLSALLLGGGIGLIGLTTLGCSSEPPKPSAAPAPARSDRPIDLQDVTLTGLDEFVAKQKGKVVLIDCWATTCKPCVKLFPHTVALHEQHEKDGLLVITVCSDPDDYRDRAAKFLKDQKATCVNFFITGPKKPKELDEKYPTDALPAIVLFDRAGNRVKALLLSDVDEKSVDEAVAAVLAGK